MLARGAEKSARLMRILNDHWLGEDGPHLGGAQPNIADFLGVCFTSIGEMIGFDFGPYPRVARWMEAMRSRPSWAEVNGPWEAWRDHCLVQRAKAGAAAS